MANESTFNTISTLVNNIQEGALLTLREQFIMRPVISVFTSEPGSNPRTLYSYSGGTVTDPLAEVTDMSSQTFTPSLKATLTPKMIGTQYFITDQRIASDWNGVIRDASLDLGAMAAENMDKSVVALFDDMDAGTVGTAGGTTDLNEFLQAISMLRTAKAPRPYYWVGHPGHWYHLVNSLTGGQTVTNSPELQDRLGRDYYMGDLYGVSCLVDANITDGGTAYGAMFSPSAMALDIRRAMRIEPQRDASRGGGGIELNMTAVYAVGEWRSELGVTWVGTSVEA
jgi:hypothetical protein